MKIKTKSTFIRKYTPQMLLFRIFWYFLDNYWLIFLAKNWISKFSDLPHYKIPIFPLKPLKLWRGHNFRPYILFFLAFTQV